MSWEPKWTAVQLDQHWMRAIKDRQPQPWINYFIASAAVHNILPEILLATGSRETRIQNIVGDSGHGRGIMQIDDRYHNAFLMSHNQGMDPPSNIDYAAGLLAAALSHFQGDYAKALASYNSGIKRVEQALAEGHIADYYTTGHDYGRDVLARADYFKGKVASYEQKDIKPS